jgi:hypothetical protein
LATVKKKAADEDEEEGDPQPKVVVSRKADAASPKADAASPKAEAASPKAEAASPKAVAKDGKKAVDDKAAADARAIADARTAREAAKAKVVVVAPEEEPEWERHYDESSGDPYWEHLVSGETTWDQPDGWKPPKGKR